MKLLALRIRFFLLILISTWSYGQNTFSEKSQLNIPITISINGISQKLNSVLQKTIYHDSITTDDHFSIKVIKTNPIQLSGKENALHATVPFEATINLVIGSGLLQAQKELVVAGILKTKTNVQLKNWETAAKTNIEQIIWHKNPGILWVNTPYEIDFLATKTFMRFKEKIVTAIDHQIEKNIQPQKIIALVSKKISEPLLIAPQHNTWAQFSATKVSLSPISINQKSVAFQLATEGVFETYTGISILEKKNTPLTFSPYQLRKAGINTHVVAMIDYDFLTEKCNENFTGMELGEGSRKVTITGIEIAPLPNSNQLIVAVKIVGKVNGTLYLSGVPEFDSKTQEVYFSQLEYQLDTKSFLTKTANWLMNGKIVQLLNEKCRFSIQSKLTEIQLALNQQLSHFSPTKGVIVQGTSNKVTIQKITALPTYLQIQLGILGQATVSVNEIHY